MSLDKIVTRILFSIVEYSKYIMSGYSSTRAGYDYPGFDIKCAPSAEIGGQDSCLGDPSCVGYTEKNGIQCNKYYIDKIVESPGTSVNFKYTGDCLKKDNTLGDYISGYCISTNLSSEIGKQNSLIRNLEANNSKLLTIGVTGQRVVFIQYGNTASFKKSQLPFANTPEWRNMTIYIYSIITITSLDKYRFEANNDKGTVEFYLNGVSLNGKFANGGWVSNDIALSPGDYFICISYDTSKAATADDLYSAYIKKGTDSSTIITNYISKPVNFLTKAENDKLVADSNFCTPDKYTTQEYCKKLIKDGTSLNSSIKEKCFTSNKYIGDDKCSALLNLSVIKSPEVNSELKEFINAEVTNWFINKISNLGTATIEEIAKLNSLFINLKDLHGNFKNLLTDNIQQAVVSYCEPRAGDVFMHTGNGVCDKLYRMDNLQDYKKIADSSNRIATNYCIKTVNGVKRYENDTWCTNIIPSYDLLNDDVKNRCMSGGVWSNDKFCNDLVEKAVSGERTMNTNLSKDMIQARNISVVEDMKAGGNVRSEKYVQNQLYDYINKLKMVGDPEGERLENSIINDKFLDYCLNKDPYLTNSSCKGVYSKYKDNINIVKSRAAMRTKNCLSDENMTELETAESIEQNKNNCKSLISGTDLNSVGVFGSKMAAYCAKGSNIVSEDCQKYYNGVSQNLANSIVKSKKQGSSGMDNRNIEDSTVWTIIIMFIVIIFMVVVFRNNRSVINKLTQVIVSKVGKSRSVRIDSA